MNIIAGIDPGLSGGLAVLNDEGDCDTMLMPVMDNLIDGGAVARWLAERDVTFAVIEQAQAYPKQGVSSAFKFGKVYGQLLGVLQASLLPYRIVTPAKWKRDMRLTYDKELSRRRAIELLPHAAHQLQFARKKDEARAEAALMAWWYLHTVAPALKGKGEKAAALV